VLYRWEQSSLPHELVTRSPARNQTESWLQKLWAESFCVRKIFCIRDKGGRRLKAPASAVKG